MEKELFCHKCDEPRKTISRKTTVIHKIKDEEIPVEVVMPYCSFCSNQLSDLATEEMHYDMALNEYRKRKNLLFPNEIKKIREKYGLSQRAFARALGFAEPTINRYEQGAIQDAVYNSLLILICNPENMIKIAQINKSNLSEKEFQIIEDKVQQLKETEQIDTTIIAKQLFEKFGKRLDDVFNVVTNTYAKVDSNYRKISAIDDRLESFIRESKVLPRHSTIVSPGHTVTWNDVIDIKFSEETSSKKEDYLNFELLS